MHYPDKKVTHIVHLPQKGAHPASSQARGDFETQFHEEVELDEAKQPANISIHAVPGAKAHDIRHWDGKKSKIIDKVDGWKTALKTAKQHSKRLGVPLDKDLLEHTEEEDMEDINEMALGPNALKRHKETWHKAIKPGINPKARVAYAAAAKNVKTVRDLHDFHKTIKADGNHTGHGLAEEVELEEGKGHAKGGKDAAAQKFKAEAKAAGMTPLELSRERAKSSIYGAADKAKADEKAKAASKIGMKEEAELEEGINNAVAKAKQKVADEKARNDRVAQAAKDMEAKDPERFKKHMKIPGFAAAAGIKEEEQLSEDDHMKAYALGAEHARAGQRKDKEAFKSHPNPYIRKSYETGHKDNWRPVKKMKEHYEIGDMVTVLETEELGKIVDISEKGLITVDTSRLIAKTGGLVTLEAEEIDFYVPLREQLIGTLDEFSAHIDTMLFGEEEVKEAEEVEIEEAEEPVEESFDYQGYVDSFGADVTAEMLVKDILQQTDMGIVEAREFAAELMSLVEGGNPFAKKDAKKDDEEESEDDEEESEDKPAKGKKGVNPFAKKAGDDEEESEDDEEESDDEESEDKDNADEKGEKKKVKAPKGDLKGSSDEVHQDFTKGKKTGE